MEIKTIKVEFLELNKGQVKGLPRNPRNWRKEDIENLKKSLIETPELFQMRGCIVYPNNGKYVVVGGNMRFMAAKELGIDVPCYVLPVETSIKKLKDIVKKDNASFGSWDTEKLKEEWEIPDSSWGVSLDQGEDAKQSEPSKEKKDSETEISVILSADEYIDIQRILLENGATKEEGLLNIINYGRK